jgi:hypothetical protein
LGRRGTCPYRNTRGGVTFEIEPEARRYSQIEPWRWTISQT